MPVSSESLFHFTGSISVLKQILKSRFSVTYCQESYVIAGEAHWGAYPMVSFCDIPLSQAKEQISRYGSFGIGLTKDWAIRHKLNPVLYLEESSLFSEDFKSVSDGLTDLLKFVKQTQTAKMKEMATEIRQIADNISVVIKGVKQDNVEWIRAELEKITNQVKPFQAGSYRHSLQLVNTSIEMTSDFSNFFRYIKSYQANLQTSKRNLKNYRFYDEREWRFIPSLSNAGFSSYLNKNEFDTYRKVSKRKPFIPGVKLPFDANDITHILVKQTKDIATAVKTIHQAKDMYANSNERDILITRIVSLEDLYGNY